MPGAAGVHRATTAARTGCSGKAIASVQLEEEELVKEEAAAALAIT